MDRCKLEYMIKNFDFNEKKKIIKEMDPYGDYLFCKDICKFLINPDTEDVDILFFIGPCHMLYYNVCSCESDPDIIELYRQDKEKELQEIKEKYINQYKLINDLCVKNNTYPFFKDPTDIKECEKTRVDIVKIIPENILNEFFGVDSLRDYEPPIYNSK